MKFIEVKKQFREKDRPMTHAAPS